MDANNKTCPSQQEGSYLSLLTLELLGIFNINELLVDNLKNTIKQMDIWYA